MTTRNPSDESSGRIEGGGVRAQRHKTWKRRTGNAALAALLGLALATPAAADHRADSASSGDAARWASPPPQQGRSAQPRSAGRHGYDHRRLATGTRFAQRAAERRRQFDERAERRHVRFHRKTARRYARHGNRARYEREAARFHRREARKRAQFLAGEERKWSRYQRRRGAAAVDPRGRHGYGDWALRGWDRGHVHGPHCAH